MTGLYLHIPFCVRKCDYCAFYSVTAGDDVQRRFLQALKGELAGLPAEFEPDTIFIGGGTPTALSGDLLEDLLNALDDFQPVEFSVEVNPGTVSREAFQLLHRHGVNRISIGVQSFDRHCLELLGRIHSAEDAVQAFQVARAVGFENISLDLIFGIPGQTMQMLEQDLDQALGLDPEHISIYNLMVEEGTPLADRDPSLLDEELEREMYDRIRLRLTQAGFLHYEISNFAKPGLACRHNLLYWSGGEYVGCGPGAHSHWKGMRWANRSDLDGYCKNGPEREFEETLNAEAKARETLVMSLRQIGGVEVLDDLWGFCGEQILALAQDGLLEVDGRRVRLTGNALFVSDSVFSELV